MSLIQRRKHRVPVAREGATGSITRFRDEMEQLFDRFVEPWSERWEEMVGRTGAWHPSVDVSESDKEVCIRTELPGIDPKDVVVKVSGNMLTISGSKKESVEEKREDYYLSERRFGSFERTIELPRSADLEHIEAEQRHGVLTVHVKKTAAAKPKAISVKTSAEKPSARVPARAAR